MKEKKQEWLERKQGKTLLANLVRFMVEKKKKKKKKNSNSYFFLLLRR